MKVEKFSLTKRPGCAIVVSAMEVTKHFSEDRVNRNAVVEAIGRGKILFKFLVDKGHRDGKEWHAITDTGLILIANAVTGRFITALIARPGQLSRYENGWYGMVEKSLDAEGNEVANVKFPQFLYRLAARHQRENLHNS